MANVQLNDQARRVLFYRLHWNIRASVHEIEIATGPHGQTTNVALLGHAFANESIANPPLSRIEVGIEECLQREDLEAEWNDEGNDGDYDYHGDCDYQAPAALVINNENGRPITLGQFVTQVHDYLTCNLDEIRSIKLDHYRVRIVAAEGTNRHPLGFPENTKIYFNGVSVAKRDGKVTFDVSLYVPGQTSWTNEEFWSIRHNFFHKYELERRV